MMDNGNEASENNGAAERKPQGELPESDAATAEGLDNLSELADALTEAANDQGDEPVEQLDPLVALEAENSELRDRILRATAEMENLRRRTEREKAEARLYAASEFARDMLSVSDNMDRALGAVSDDQRVVADEITRTLLDGVEMVQRELLNIFEKHGIKRIDPAGERFDPNLHQAMFEIPDTETASGTVLQVVQPGFVIGERVLRPAMVGVAKGGPKPQTSETGNGDASNDTPVN